MTACGRAVHSMHMSYQPPFASGDNRPRSTPISNDAFIAPPMQEPVPPTVSSFLGNDVPTQPAFAGPKRKRSWGCGIVGLVIVAAGIAGIAAAVTGVMKAKDSVDKALNQSIELSDPNLSDNDRAVLGLTGSEQTMFEGSAPGAVAAAFDAAIPGEPTMLLEMLLYPDYAFATAQNSILPDHFDEYGWRTGTVGAPSPEQNDAEAANAVFSVSEVNWAGLSALVADAVNVTKVEQGAVTHVSVSRDTFSPDLAIVIRVYVTGPRSSAFIEADADGTVTQIF